ncbi:MAG: leucine-rich repeat protein [Muribaculaceae bacterium]|nr:leucine-rich repeat protein [Muribaculaceae bacterium]
MKRKRLLALFLVLSMAFDSGSFTALAAGTGTDENTAMAADEIDITEETDAGETNDTAADTDGNGEIKDETPDEGGTGEAGTETGRPETGEPDGNEDGSGGAETETPGEGGSGNNGAETGTPDEGGSEDENNGAETETPGEGGSENNGAQTGDGETDVEEPDETDEPDTEETGAETAVKNVQMRTFTDETGMVVTYDASEEYQYTVTAGVLTDIRTSNGEAVSGTVVISSAKGIKTIGENAFQGNREVTYVKLPSGVEAIGQNAFKNCEKLEGITIPTGVETIGDGAFEDCQALTQLAIPKTVTTIGSRAFYGDASLFMVYMKDALYSSLQSIGDYAFYHCTALTQFCSDADFVFPVQLQDIGASAFEGCEAIKKIVLPDSVTTIGNGVFQKCSALTEVTLSNGVETISDYAFYGCSNLVLVNFASAKLGESGEAVKPGNQVIASHAFENCSKLGSVVLPPSLKEIQSYAFDGCTGLKRVEIPAFSVQFGADLAFPNNVEFYMIGFKDSSVESYATAHSKIKFLLYNPGDTEEFFQCVVQPGENKPTDVVVDIYVYDKDLNKKANEQNGKKGVKAGTELYVSISGLPDGYQVVKDSLCCNGVPIVKNKQGDNVFKMPRGGALITLEFTSTSANNYIKGIAKDVRYEFSNGEVLLAGNGVELKVGQTTRLFLVDTSDKNSVIPTSKITFKSNKKEVATVSADGTIKALKKGSATITTTVLSRLGDKIEKNFYIEVVKADVETLKLKLSSVDNYVVIDEVEVGGIQMQRLTIDQTRLNGADLTFQATATAYDENDDNLSIALKWASSDTSVAKLAKASTAEASSSNTVTIPKSAGGEATITATATNADKKTVTSKFLVCVRDFTPILGSAKLNLNPNQEDGTELTIIGAYGQKIDETAANKVEIVSIVNKTESRELDAKYDKAASTDTVARFKVTTGGRTIADGTKSLFVKITVASTDYVIPLKVVVKSSYPNPKVAYVKKQPKINLFYANDGTEIQTVVTNLGDAEISGYDLEPLAEDKDGIFTRNFTVDNEGVITQESESMLPYTHNNKNQPAVTGYLVLKFKGYMQDRKEYTKKYKITIPTQTVKPSYKLDKTAGTFQSSNATTVTLKVIDKKTKEQLVLDSNYTIENLYGSCVRKEQYSINEDGEIELTTTASQSSGNFKFSISNNEWAPGSAFTFTYKITVSDNNPKITLKSATVKLNKKYSEQPAEFMLSSNQLGTQFASDQEFIAQAPRGKEEEYAKIGITCDENGNGRVEFLDSDIEKGTYKYKCTVQGLSNGYDTEFNTVTLTVKVEDTAPTVTAKGSLTLNRNAIESEISELALTYKNLPQEYEIEEQETIGSIHCTTRNREGLEESFSWKIEDNKLKAGLLDLKPDKGTYSFTMTPSFSGPGGSVAAKAINFKVKVHKGAISVKLSTKGKVNLLARDVEEYTQKNSIICTPTITNLKDTVAEAKLYDVTTHAVEYEDNESEYFDVALVEGKLYITPKADVEIQNNKNYKVKVWVRLENYSFEGSGGGTWCAKDLTIKTAQTLPKITTDKSSLNLYTAQKDYEAVFRVTPKEGSVGKVSGISFGEKDEKSWDSFELDYTPKDDGTLEVVLKLKTPSYACNKANKIKMYVEFEGQGVNTSGTAITMSVNIVSRN